MEGEIFPLYQTLVSDWSKKPPNLNSVGSLLGKLKIALTQLTFLPTSKSTVTSKELQLARDILEIGVQWSIAKHDIPSFERYMAQLKCYYMDYNHELPESPYKYQILGLNLLFLLSQNRVAEFHTELELLPPDLIQTNKFIRHPVSLEQHLMEGNYNKIFLAKGNVPADSYNFFIDILLDTNRNEIAACLEKAYRKISSSDAARMLNISNQSALKDYAAKRRWKLGKDGYYCFDCFEEKKGDEVIPSRELVEQTMEYARELEMIV